jgi:hypothetical protein
LKRSRVHFLWQKDSVSSFRTGVSLHSHTLHSHESLDFIERATANTAWLSGALRKQKAKYRAVKGRDLDLTRAWWTPPLSPRQAWDLEGAQIRRTLGMDALVSISDHDNIDACLNLHMIEKTKTCHFSIEWTVPFRQTFFHIGVHNLPADLAAAMTRAMNEFTKNPVEREIGPMLEWLGAASQSLIILNHPCWDENHVGKVTHSECVDSFIEAFRPFLHALELNGLRPWNENRRAAQLAVRYLQADVIVKPNRPSGREYRKTSGRRRTFPGCASADYLRRPGRGSR